MTPKVTVISISYNHAKFVEQCVESVLSQKTNFAFNYIVSDDCSTDDTQSKLQELSKRHPERIQLVLREKNMGVAKNFRDVYQMATGEYLAIVECDDYWTDPNKLQKQVDALEANKQCSLCFHATTYVNESGQPTGWVHPEHFKKYWTLEEVVQENPVQTCSIVLRRDWIPQLPEFFLSLKLGDWPLCILAARRGPFILLSEQMAAYRVHANGVWSGLALAKKHAALASMYLKIALEYPDLAPLMESALSQQAERLAVASMEAHALRATRTWRVGSMVVRPALWLRSLLAASRSRENN